MAVPEPRPVEDHLLFAVYRELVRQRDYEGAEEVVDLLTSAVAVEELIAALERDDGEAMAFHAAVVLRNLDTERQREFRIVD